MLEYTTAQKAVSEIRSGDHIHLSAISSVPQVLVRALKERADNYISISHPDDREMLKKNAHRRFRGVYKKSNFLE